MSTNLSGIGMSITVKSPVALGTPAITEIIKPALVTSYTHKLASFGGYESAEIKLLMSSIAEAELWFSSALGWHIEVFGRSGIKVWEGFVNSITLNGGIYTAQHGPLMDVANRVSVMYTPIIGWDADGKPILGTQTETTVANDTVSQARFGILETVLSGGQLVDDGTTNVAEFVRNVYLAENAYPKTTSSIAMGGGTTEGVSITLSCRGYFDWLEKYVYNYGGYSTTVTASDKLMDVLAADPNSIFSTYYGLIESNASLLEGNEDSNRTAATIVKEILTLGDGTDTPYTFGIYDKQQAKYTIMPTQVEYFYRVLSSKSTLVAQNESPVDPYDVLPGKWAMVTDFQIDAARQGLSVVEDPRTIFIESVDFTAPNSVNISGSPIVTFPQLLAKIGFTGFP